MNEELWMKLCIADGSTDKNKLRKQRRDEKENQKKKKEKGKKRMEAMRTGENKQSGGVGVREEGNPDKKSWDNKRKTSLLTRTVKEATPTNEKDDREAITCKPRCFLPESRYAMATVRFQQSCSPVFTPKLPDSILFILDFNHYANPTECCQLEHFILKPFNRYSIRSILSFMFWNILNSLRYIHRRY